MSSSSSGDDGVPIPAPTVKRHPKEELQEVCIKAQHEVLNAVLVDFFLS